MLSGSIDLFTFAKNYIKNIDSLTLVKNNIDFLRLIEN